LISSTMHIAVLLDNNKSHLLPPHITYAYDLNPNPIAEALIPFLGSTVGCADYKFKIPTRRTSRNMLREVDHRSLPLDAQCHERK
jgi:hypothetical protein